MFANSPELGTCPRVLRPTNPPEFGDGEKVKIRAENLNLWYGDFQALIDVTMAVREKSITALIGSSGCGKSTLLRCLNRMNDLIDDVRIEGSVRVDGRDIYASAGDLPALRKKVGMVFQRPNPFPLSIYENVAFGPRVHHQAKGGELDGLVEESLRAVDLWDVLKDRLRENALKLSLEQKQRLCIARLAAVKSEVVLMDEPCSALDPYATMKIEDLMRLLKAKFTIVIVTHNMQQAARVSDETGFMLLGELVEFGATTDIFTRPRDKRTEDYITGRFG
ncbi:MAG: phosphate ABC transporter ATP-binding protein [Candidatus Aminicenantes bacterium]|nr:phosphate ABC transporter ATP-binding protein [Candidatus Aminicenantes bacterium]